MSAKTYAGLGPDTLVPRLKPTALSQLKLGAEEGFVLSRVDGKSTVGEICLLVPFDAQRTARILAELQRVGALDIPGSEVMAVAPLPMAPLPVAPPPVDKPVEKPPRADKTPLPVAPPRADKTPLPVAPPRADKTPLPVADQPRARVATPMIDGLELTLEQARRIDEFFFSLDERDAFELLEVARGSDKKEIKRAYFKMSKEFHPDRFFNKNIGPYKERLSKIFQSIKAAFELLSDDVRRAAYEESAK